MSLRALSGSRLAGKSTTATLRNTRPRASLRIRANITWQLVPDPSWSKKHNAQALKPIDLTPDIGRKAVCTVGDELQHSNDCDKVITHADNNVHVMFEAKGEANPLDSGRNSALFVEDIDSSVEVLCDGAPLPKGEMMQVHPGSVLTFGDQAAYQVQRNVQAHA